MGCAASRRCAELKEEAAALRIKIHALDAEVRREKEETTALRKKLAAEERRRRELEELRLMSKEELQVINTCRMVEQMKAEQERREMAVEKWKQLYLAIKAELDALILRTKEGEGLWGAEEEAAERLRGEMKAKEAAIGALRARLEAAEEERTKREREMDILRQSLRILTGKLKKKTRFRRNLRS